jgi:hypothetical protein
MTDLDNAIAQLEAAGIETPNAVVQWVSWFHGEAPFAARSVISDTADAAIMALATIACELLADEQAAKTASAASRTAPALSLVARLSA